jgi:ABC-2 type transport system ATP-binding protein
LLDRLSQADLEPAELTMHTPDLDDVFLALTGHSAQLAAASTTENGAGR